MNQVPRWLNKYMTSECATRVTQAITSAERATSGEVVVMLVRQSSSFRHVYPMCALMMLALSLAIIDLCSYYSAWSPDCHLSLTAQVALLVGGQILAWFLSKVHFVKRMLTPGPEIIERSEQRAYVEFHQAGLHRTKDQTGILIFVSFLEHRVVVLGDAGISSKISQDTWSELVSEVIASVKANKLADGLESAVGKCGKILAQHFPIKSDDRNELPDHFIMKD